RSPMPTARTSSCTSRRRNVSRRPGRACCTAPANARQCRMHRCDLSRRRPRTPQAPHLEEQPLLKPETTMKLLYQTHSPYARKALVFAHEAGLADRIEVVHNETSPTQRNEQVFAQNPLGKVPVLIRPGQAPIFESDVICAYLDTLHGGRRLIPAEGEARWHALQVQAVAQGLCDAGIAVRWETVRRPEALRYPQLRDGYVE